MYRVLLVVCLSALLLSGGRYVESQTLSAADWQQDLDFAAEAIRIRHPNPFHFISEDAFQARANVLRGRIPELEDHEIVVELSILVASIQDGNTAIRGGFQFLTGQYPIQFDSYADGLFVKSAPDALSGVVGTRLLRIDDVSADQVSSRIGAMTYRDNAMTLQNRVPSSMVIPEILHAFGITQHRDRARFVFVDQAEREFILDLIPLLFDRQHNWVQVLPVDQRPLYLRAPGRNYLHEYLENSESLYVQYNQVRNGPIAPGVTRHSTRSCL